VDKQVDVSQLKREVGPDSYWEGGQKKKSERYN